MFSQGLGSNFWIRKLTFHTFFTIILHRQQMYFAKYAYSLQLTKSANQCNFGRYETALLVKFFQRILTWEKVSLDFWPPVYFVWAQLLCLCWISISFTSLVEFNPVKQEVNCTMILPLKLVFSGSYFLLSIWLWTTLITKKLLKIGIIRT